MKYIIYKKKDDASLKGHHIILFNTVWFVQDFLFR